jgi:mono/diheme cytochrome c family protein
MRALITCAAVLIMAGAASVQVAPLAAQAAGARSVREGVYTEAQAERGKAVFEEQCTDCHSAKMWGTDWTGKSVADVYDIISNYMPEPKPGSLSPQQVRDVLAHILKSNNLPAGMTELPAMPADLQAITLEPAVAR